MAISVAHALIPARQRHWLGDKFLLASDAVRILPAPVTVPQAVASFWFTLAHNPEIDHVMFVRA